MNIEDKTKEQLIEELRTLHQRVADLECRLQELKQGKEFSGDARIQLVSEPPEDLAKVPEPDKMLQQEVARRTQLESQLAQSEQLYRKLVETARDVIWTVDLDLNYTYVSPSVSKVLGYTVEEIMSMNPLSTMTPLSRDRIVGAFQEELALEASGSRDKYTGRSEEIEQHHKDGSTRWQEITTTFLRANDGGPIGILGISHDITERKHMEEELRQSRDELEQKVQERTSDLTKLNKRLLLEIDERKKVEEEFRQGEERLELALKGADLGLWDLYPQAGQGFINQRSAEIVGYSLAEIQPSLGFWESLLHPDDRVRTVETLLAHLEGRTDYYEDEYRVKTKSGEWKWIFSGGKVVEHDPDGRPLRMSGIYRDITERKRAGKDLLESRERLQTVLDTIPAAVFWKDSDSVYVGANRAWLVAAGLNSSQEVVGKTDYDLPWEKGQADSYREHDRKVIESGIPVYDIIEPYTRADGTLAWARTNKVPLRDLEDNVVGILGTYEDVTDRKRTEELALQSARLRSVADLSSGVAHHFNNLLQIILASTSLSLADLESGDLSEVKTNLEKMLEAASLGAETVKRLQTFANVRADVAEHESDVFDVATTVRNAAEVSKPLWKLDPEKKGIKIELQLEIEDGCLVKGRENEIFEVLINLIRNAAEAMPQGGDIEIKTYKEANEAVITVRDTGIGIAEEDLNRVFQPFWSSKGVGIGKGMGLAVTHGLVKRHGGTISVQSRVGAGTTFAIRLPLAQDPIRKTEQPEMSTAGEHLTILVIEDELPIATLLERIFAKAGHRVFKTLSGEEGLAVFHKKPVDLVICDLGMPGMNGWDVGKAIQSICQERGIAKPPFVLLTGWGGQELEKEKIAESGTDAVVAKPIDSTALLATVQEIAARL